MSTFRNRTASILRNRRRKRIVVGKKQAVAAPRNLTTEEGCSADQVENVLAQMFARRDPIREQAANAPILERLRPALLEQDRLLLDPTDFRESARAYRR